MAQLALAPFFRATDSNGDPLPNARLYTFLEGTLTPTPTYTTDALSVSHGSYVQADSGGLFPAAYLNPAISTRGQIRISPYSAAVSGMDFDPLPGFEFTNIITDANYSTLQAALTAAAGKALMIVTDWAITSAVTVPDNTAVYGMGGSVTVSVSETNGFIAGNGCSFHDIDIIGPANSATVVDFATSNGIYANDKDKLIVKGCRIRGWNCCGIQARDCNDVLIEGNILWQNFYGDATGADILLYSGTAGRRAIINANECLSNNSQGIFVNALGKDADIIVSNNICVALATDGTEYTMPTSNAAVRRHGILATYESTSTTGRILIANNLCRNTLWTGIYAPTSGAVAGPIIITGNVCTKNGYEIGNSSSGGIYADALAPVTIEGNLIVDYQGDTVGAITLTAAADLANSASVRNNTILASLSHGIYATGRLRHCDITGNKIVSPGKAGIHVALTAAITAAGGFNIEGNTIVRAASNFSGIFFAQEAGTLPSRIVNNKIKGFDAATNASWNSGIRLATLADAQICSIIGNRIDTFYFGVYYSGYFTSATRFTGVFADYNDFVNLALGIMANANAVTTAAVPFEGNTYTTVTNRFGDSLGLNAGYDVRRTGTKFEVYGFTAVPTVGQWAVGDRFLNQAGTVGQPKAWTCTTAPTTYTSEGNL